MLTFRLMVTMVAEFCSWLLSFAEFCSLVFLIHKTLLGEITVSSTRTTRVNGILYLYSLSCNDTF